MHLYVLAERTKITRKGGGGGRKKKDDSGSTTEDEAPGKKKQVTTKLLKVKLSDSDSDFDLKPKYVQLRNTIPYNIQTCLPIQRIPISPIKRKLY